MARRKDTGAWIIGLTVAFLTLLVVLPKGTWVVVGIFALAGVAVYAVRQKEEVPRSTALSAEWTPEPAFAEDGEPVSVHETFASQSSNSEFRIPQRAGVTGAARWLRADEPIKIGNLAIPGGLIYVGRSLPAFQGEPDPCLINPTLKVAARGSYAERQFGYWPSYSEISPSARRAYLTWLAGGRRDPTADIGYVFLFFYGLERRVLIDATNNPMDVEDELPTIKTELRRLLDIYGATSGSFHHYAGELLNYVELVTQPAKAYEGAIPSFPKTFELPLYIRLALGRAATDGAPVSSRLALAWAKLDPNIRLRTPAVRCAEEFDRHFRQKYEETYDAGMILPKNRTKLKFMYRPASAGFQGRGEITITFGNIPDVTALTAPVEKIRSLVEDCTEDLDAYSRLIGKNPDAKASLEAMLLLPIRLWSEPARRALATLKVKLAHGPQVMSLQELLTSLGAQGALTREKMLTLVRSLDRIKIGVEPDIFNGARVPKPEDYVAVFATVPEEPGARAVPAYRVAALSIELSSAIAAADGDVGADEVGHLHEEMKAWDHLLPHHVQRLQALLALLQRAPVALTSLKKKIEPLAAGERETIASFMATIAQADGVVSPAEVKLLEKVYKVLGVEPKKVFSDLHAVAAGARQGVPVVRKAARAGLKLDPRRIAALQKDTQAVSALLAGIFTEESAAAPAAVSQPAEVEADDSPQAEGLLGLDSSHSALARLLLSRPHWAREELVDVAADLDLMLDGALERINEAAFDAYAIPFTEAADPVEINPEILEKIAS